MTPQRPRGRPPHPDVLTPAEWRVVDAVRHGMANGEIARRQGLTLDAVKYHVSNALSKLGMKSRIELRRWEGISAASHLHARAQEGTMQPLALGQVARSVSNIDEAVAFYRDVVQLPHLYTFGKLAFFDCGANVRLFLSEGDSPSVAVLYFRVEEIHAAKAALESRGAHFVSAPHCIHRHEDGTEEWLAFFEDNEKRPLGLMCQVGSGGAAGVAADPS